MVVAPEATDREKALKGLEDYHWKIHDSERREGLRRAIFHMIKGCMTPGDFGLTNSELAEFGDEIDFDSRLYQEVLGRFFMNKRGY